MTDIGLSIAIIIATLAGPIVAVQLTRFLDDRAQKVARRANTFRTLMATRGATISPEHVGALNTAEVDFYGVPQVEQALEAYIAHLNTATGPTEGEAQVWVNKQRDLLAVLLGKMAVTLKITKSEIHIRQGGYYPKGWADRETRQNAAQAWIIKLSEGNATLPVKIVQS